MSFDRLIAKIIETKNPTVAGLDPKLDYIPVYIKEESYAKYGKNLEGAALRRCVWCDFGCLSWLCLLF